MRKVLKDDHYIFWEKDIEPPADHTSTKADSAFMRHFLVVIFLFSGAGFFLALFSVHVESFFRDTHKRTLTIVDSKTHKDSIYIVVTAGEGGKREEGYFRFYPTDTTIYYKKQSNYDLKKWEIDSLYPRYIKLDSKHHVFEVLADDFGKGIYQNLNERDKTLLAWYYYFDKRLQHNLSTDWYNTDYIPSFYDIGDCAVGRANKDTTIYFYSMSNEIIH